MNKSCGGHFENQCFSIIITSRAVIIARYDVILDQSERAHLYNHLSNYTKCTYAFSGIKEKITLHQPGFYIRNMTGTHTGVTTYPLVLMVDLRIRCCWYLVIFQSLWAVWVSHLLGEQITL